MYQGYVSTMYVWIDLFFNYAHRMTFRVDWKNCSSFTINGVEREFQVFAVVQMIQLSISVLQITHDTSLRRNVDNSKFYVYCNFTAQILTH